MAFTISQDADDSFANTIFCTFNDIYYLRHTWEVIPDDLHYQETLCKLQFFLCDSPDGEKKMYVLAQV